MKQLLNNLVKQLLNNLALCAVLAFAIASAGSYASAQTIITPQESQRAWTGQRIGVTDITVEYSRPSVKGRQIWGSLVPFGEVWRAGANENTVITTTHAVVIEGKTLPAGRYGVHMIPTSGAWTVIFNKESNAWGSYFYKQSEDALRTTVTPRAAEQQEQLTYAIVDVFEDRCIVSMRWDKVDVRIPIIVDI